MKWTSLHNICFGLVCSTMFHHVPFLWPWGTVLSDWSDCWSGEETSSSQIRKNPQQLQSSLQSLFSLPTLGNDPIRLILFKWIETTSWIIVTLSTSMIPRFASSAWLNGTNFSREKIACKHYIIYIIYIIYIPRTQMTLLLIEKGLVLEGWPSKIEVSWGSRHTYIHIMCINMCQ